MPRGKDSSSKSNKMKGKSPNRVSNKHDKRNLNEINAKKLFDHINLIENEEKSNLIENK